MGRKTNEQRYADQLREMLTVGELFEMLKEHPSDMPVGLIGHFGEFHPLTKYDLCEGKAYITPNGSWRTEKRMELEILEIQCPDIGPEPN